MEQRY